MGSLRLDVGEMRRSAQELAAEKQYSDSEVSAGVDMPLWRPFQCFTAVSIIVKLSKPSLFPLCLFPQL